MLSSVVPAGAAAGADAGVRADPNKGLTIEGSVLPLVPLVPLPKPKPKPVDDVLSPAPVPTGEDARAAKPPLPPPLPKTGAFEPEPNIGAVFS